MRQLMAALSDCLASSSIRRQLFQRNERAPRTEDDVELEIAIERVHLLFFDYVAHTYASLDKVVNPGAIATARGRKR
jgi:hypothetical protein